MKNKFVKISVLFLVTILAQNILAQEKTVKFQFNILDETGNFVYDLKTSDIQILQDKKTLQLNSIESKFDLPLEIVIMIDASASQERMISFEKTFAENIIDNILNKEKDKVAVVKFSGEVLLMQDLTNDFIKAKEQLKLIEFEPPQGFIGGGVTASPFPQNSKQIAKGSTSIWDSVKDVVSAFSNVKNNNSRKIVILISDGVNTYGESKLKEVVFSSLKNQVPIYAVGIGDSNYEGVDKKNLKKLTEQTSGILVLPNEKGKDLLKDLEMLKKALRSSYEANITINQINSKDSVQELTVEIINPDLRKKKLHVIQPKGLFCLKNNK